MSSPSFRFADFLLDPRDRRLHRDGAPIDINARYLDALVLLVRERGKLVSKDRFHDEVWSGVPVTDEALTQCIKTLRRQLGDSAAAPQFIETVPKHGYRFIATVEIAEPDSAPASDAPASVRGSTFGSALRHWLLVAAAGTLGAGFAGFFGGLALGLASAAQPLAPGMGAISLLLVLICLTIVVALTGGAGVSLGIAAANLAARRASAWTIVGGTSGGLVIGAAGKLLGIDAFNVLLGASPGDITGPSEGALLGAAVGCSAWLAFRQGCPTRLRRGIAVAVAIGGITGAAIPLLGGRLMSGSLDLLSRNFPGSRFRLDHLGHLFGESNFGTVAQVVTGAAEGLLFAASMVGAMILADRHLGADQR